MIDLDELIEEAESWVAHTKPSVVGAILRDMISALESVRAERDAALAAIERVRAMHARRDDLKHPDHEGPVCDGCGDTNGFASPWPCPTVAALDGAPEPEWELGAALVSDPSEATAHADKETALKNITGWNESVARIKRMGRHTSGPSMLVRRRPAGPWLPVGGDDAE